MLSKVKKRVDKFHLACNTEAVKKLTLVVTLQLLLSELEILLTVGRPFVDWTAFFYFPLPHSNKNRPDEKETVKGGKPK